MRERNFEDFLQDMHGSLFQNILDDNLPDHFDNWIASLEGEDYMQYADIFGRERFLAGMDDVIQKI